MLRQIEGSHWCRRSLDRAATDTLQQRLDVVALARMALHDRPLQALGSVPFTQELQDADKVANAAGPAVLTFQVGAQLVEDCRQTPVAEDVGVVQRRRLAAEDLQVMLGVQALLVAAVQPRMPGHDLLAGHNDDLVDVALDRHRAKGVAARHAVAVAVEADCLELVHLRRLRNAGIKGIWRQGQRLGSVASEALADALDLARLDTLTFCPAAAQQVRVQIGQALHHGHGRGPVTLQMANAALDARLLLRPTHQAEQRRETVMTGQRLIALVQVSLAALEDGRRYGGRVVPPQFARHRAKEGERLDEAEEDGFAALTGQRDGEGAVRVGPSHQEHRHLSAPLGEVHVDVPEVTLGALAGIVGERNEGLRRAPLLGANVETYPFLTTLVAMFVTQATKNLGGRVPLFAWRLLVRLQNGIDRCLERIENRRRRLTPIRLGLRLPEDLANLAPRVMEATGQLPNAELLRGMGMANARVLVHLDDHPSPPCS